MENLYQSEKKELTLNTLKNNWKSANQVIVADLNQDGLPDIAAVANREWLWRRPYTLVEVQVYDDDRTILPVDTAMAGLKDIVI